MRTTPAEFPEAHKMLRRPCASPSSAFTIYGDQPPIGSTPRLIRCSSPLSHKATTRQLPQSRSSSVSLLDRSSHRRTDFCSKMGNRCQGKIVDGSTGISLQSTLPSPSASGLTQGECTTNPPASRPRRRNECCRIAGPAGICQVLPLHQCRYPHLLQQRNPHCVSLLVKAHCPSP